MNTFTPFWTSTSQAQRRTAKQEYHQHRKQQREQFFDPDRFLQIALPRGRFMTVRRQIKAIKRAMPYKLRKPELQALELFLIRNHGLHYIILPKQRVNNRSIDFNDARLKYIEKG